ncbi:MAG: glycosyltransferase family 2 protein [Phyllobacteriaceae bacterium]|nr:glycosyltransferase family 2 protein [Phyllobacteriaceae bacterium]
MESNCALSRGRRTFSATSPSSFWIRLADVRRWRAISNSQKALKILRREGFGGLRWRVSNFDFSKYSQTFAVAPGSSSRPLSDVSRRRRNTLFSNWHVLAASSSSETSDLPCITISVVLFNSEKWLRPFFDSILAQRYPLKRVTLHFVDHGSYDGTLSVIDALILQHSALFRAVHVSSRPNSGYGSGNDFAIRKAKDDWIVVSNVDVEFLPDSLLSLIRTAVHDDADVASWEMRQAPYEHPKYYDPVTLETNWSSHACILLRKSAYIKVGGYEKAIFMYGEDVELSYRFRSAGYRLRYVPKAVIIHHVDFDNPDLRPTQFAGSLASSILLRYRYGTPEQISEGEALFDQLRMSPGDDKRRAGIERAHRLIAEHKSHFLLANKADQYGPFAFYWLRLWVNPDWARCAATAKGHN